MEQTTESRAKKKSTLAWPLSLLGIFLLSVVLYLPSLMWRPISDDEVLLAGKAFGENTLHAAFTEPFFGQYFRPLTSASFVLDSSYAGSNPFYFHQTNILLHALTAVLVACLAFCITQNRWAGILGGLFFAAQPLQVGATAWIGGRTDTLSAFFLAALMVSLVQYHRTSKAAWLASAIVSFLLCSFCQRSRPSRYFRRCRFRYLCLELWKWKDAWRLSIPFGLALILYVGLWAIGAPAPLGVRSSLSDTVDLALRTACHYGLALLTPNNPSMITFTLENYRGIQWVLVGALFVALFGLFVKRTWSRHREWTWLAVCLLLVYMPISNFPTIPSLVVGPYRFAEAGTAAACLMGVICWAGFTSRRFLVAGLLAANLVTGAVVTWWGIHQWTAPAAFFEAVATNDPHSIDGVANYALALEKVGKAREAYRRTNDTLTWVFGSPHWAELLSTGELNPRSPAIIRRMRTNAGAPPWIHLATLISFNGVSLAEMRHPAIALIVQRDALVVAPNDQRMNFMYANMLLSTNRQLATHYYEIALEADPRSGTVAASSCPSALDRPSLQRSRRFVGPPNEDLVIAVRSVELTWRRQR